MALLISTSIWPKWPIACSIIHFTLASSRTSTWTHKVSVSLPTSAALRCILSRSKSAMTTLAFFSAKVLAACLPMPWPLPVMITTFPSSMFFPPGKPTVGC
jgi:hypothetical protein